MTPNFCRKKAVFINKPLAASDIEKVNGIRAVGSGEVAALTEITADAFRGDPFNNWLWENFGAMKRVFGIFAKYVYAPNGFCQILREDGQDLAATMWMMPGADLNTPFIATAKMGLTALLSGGMAGARRAEAVGKAMEQHHLQEPHAYLFTVGVMGEGRGRGLGRKLVQPVLEACDRTSTLAYLENSNPANTRVYNSLGFKHVAMIEPVPGCPPLEAMRREPR